MSDLPKNLGPNFGRCLDDPDWDAIHIVDPLAPGNTLCGISLGEVAQAASMATGLKPGQFDGCWTCLAESNRWATGGEMEGSFTGPSSPGET